MIPLPPSLQPKKVMILKFSLFKFELIKMILLSGGRVVMIWLQLSSSLRGILYSVKLLLMVNLHLLVVA